MKEIETGLPFYDDIDKQIVNKPYFNAHIKDWICPTTHFLPFQAKIAATTEALSAFNLVNYDTGATTDYLTHFNANTSLEEMGFYNVLIYDGDVALTLTPGRYYFYILTDGGYEYYSEVFVIRDLQITASVAYEEFKEIEIGLPFYDSYYKQVVHKPYYNSSIKEWLCANNRLPSFQFKLPEIYDPTIVTFNLVNYDTGATTDILLYFNSYVAYTDRSDNGHYYTHLGTANLGLSLSGRYYLYAESTEGMKWWSEVFAVCGNITETTDYLLIDKSDYLLIGAGDKLKIA